MPGPFALEHFHTSSAQLLLLPAMQVGHLLQQQRPGEIATLTRALMALSWMVVGEAAGTVKNASSFLRPLCPLLLVQAKARPC